MGLPFPGHGYGLHYECQDGRNEFPTTPLGVSPLAPQNGLYGQCAVSFFQVCRNGGRHFLIGSYMKAIITYTCPGFKHSYAPYGEVIECVPGLFALYRLLLLDAARQSTILCLGVGSTDGPRMALMVQSIGRLYFAAKMMQLQKLVTHLHYTHQQVTAIIS